jgi:hypothetical protein
MFPAAREAALPDHAPSACRASVDRPMPRSSAISRCVRPLVSIRRTAYASKSLPNRALRLVHGMECSSFRQKSSPVLRRKSTQRVNMIRLGNSNCRRSSVGGAGQDQDLIATGPNQKWGAVLTPQMPQLGRQPFPSPGWRCFQVAFPCLSSPRRKVESPPPRSSAASRCVRPSPRRSASASNSTPNRRCGLPKKGSSCLQKSFLFPGAHAKC